MNIFSMTILPTVNAMMLDDARLNKMILESGQILSSALWLNESKFITYTGVESVIGRSKYELLYKPTHINHPVVRWAAMHPRNMRYVFETMIAFNQEKIERGGVDKDHATVTRLEDPTTFIIAIMDFIWDNPLTNNKPTPPNCAANAELNLDYKDQPLHTAYKKYIVARWMSDKRKPTWNNTNPPSLWTPELEDLWSPKNMKFRLSIRNDLTRGVIPSIIPK